MTVSVSSDLSLGVIFAVVAGLMNGTFTLPMRFLGRWSWENVWALFIIVCCVLMPVAVVSVTTPGFVHVLASAPLAAVLVAIATGFAWGFGAIMFGQGISAIGISMGNTLVLAISSSFGSLIPMLILDPHRFALAQGRTVAIGTVIGVVGIVFCGYAGFLKEQSQRSRGGAQSGSRGEMVGKARPYRTGLLLCTGSGLLSAVFNIGYSEAQGVVQTAVHLGYNAFAGSNVVWLLMLTSGAIVNLIFCGYLFSKNGSWSKYALPGSTKLYVLVVLMGLMWGTNIFLYGFAAPKLGKIGPAIGWPLLLIVGLVTANFWGFVAGEWRAAQAKDLRWMFSGLAVLLIAIIVLGWSSTLA